MTVSPRADDAWAVIPLYNEAPVIGEVLAGLLPHVGRVVCVDDASQDAGAAIAERAGATVVRHAINLGQGAALQTGIRYAVEAGEATYVITFDADGQHRVQDAMEMLQRARDEDLAIVFGSRFLDRRTSPGRVKKVVLKVAVWITNQQTGMRLSDAHNGLRVIRRDAAQALNLQQNRMAHATEIVLQLGRTRLPWAEHPVHVLYTDYSRSKGQSLINAVNILIDSLLK